MLALCPRFTTYKLKNRIKKMDESVQINYSFFYNCFEISLYLGYSMKIIVYYNLLIIKVVDKLNNNKRHDLKRFPVNNIFPHALPRKSLFIEFLNVNDMALEILYEYNRFLKRI